jgi:hypothetical protein
VLRRRFRRKTKILIGHLNKPFSGHWKKKSNGLFHALTEKIMLFFLCFRRAQLFSIT